MVASMSNDSETVRLEQDALLRTAEALAPLLYAELRRTARRMRWQTGGGETLQTTVLVHEAFLKLRATAGFSDAKHFLRASAMAMRQVLIDSARASLTAKRGAGVDFIALDDAEAELFVADDAGLMALNKALQALETVSPRLAQVVECRYFGGLSDLEIGQALDLTERTVRRDWQKARAWLLRELGQDALTDGLEGS
jgi:RNA polymerase sigma factor (TIGR02999 family)